MSRGKKDGALCENPEQHDLESMTKKQQQQQQQNTPLGVKNRLASFISRN